MPLPGSFVVKNGSRIFFKSSALPVAFLAAGLAFGAAFLASAFGAAALGSAFLVSFFGSAFLAPEAVIPSITISVKACLCPFLTR